MADTKSQPVRRTPRSDDDQHLMAIYDGIEKKSERNRFSLKCLSDCSWPVLLVCVIVLVGLAPFLIGSPRCWYHHGPAVANSPAVQGKNEGTIAGQPARVMEIPARGPVSSNSKEIKVPNGGSSETDEDGTGELAANVLAVTGSGEPSETNEFMRMLKERALDNQIVLTVTTSLFENMTMNLLCSFEKISLKNYIVGTLDKEIHEKLKSMGYPVFPAYKDSILGGDELESAVKRQAAFHKVNFVKEEIVLWAIEAGYEAVMTDADLVWYVNPMQDLRENYRDYDYAFQVAVTDEEGNYQLNGGLFYVKPTAPSIAAMRILLSRLYEDFSRNDQTEFRNVLCEGLRRTNSDTCFDPISGASTLLLPTTTYAKSAIINAQEDYRAALVKFNPFTLHYNGGSVDKKQSYMELHGLWYLNGSETCNF